MPSRPSSHSIRFPRIPVPKYDNTIRRIIDEYDPRLANICREVFGDTEVRYTKPATRLSEHLEGYDHADAPRFEWPERLKEASAAIRPAAQQREQRFLNDHSLVSVTIRAGTRLPATASDAASRIGVTRPLEVNEKARRLGSCRGMQLNQVTGHVVQVLRGPAALQWATLQS